MFRSDVIYKCKTRLCPATLRSQTLDPLLRFARVFPDGADVSDAGRANAAPWLFGEASLWPRSGHKTGRSGWRAPQSSSSLGLEQPQTGNGGATTLRSAPAPAALPRLGRGNGHGVRAGASGESSTSTSFIQTNTRFKYFKKIFIKEFTNFK